MERTGPPTLPRRLVIRLAAALSAFAVTAAWSRRARGDRPAPAALAQTEEATTPAATEAVALPPTPTCGDDDDLDTTVPQTAGPFFTPNSPERTSLLEPGLAGTRLVVTGYVYSTECRPVPGALLDFWQADDGGAYDNAGYTLRGHQFTDEDGRYRLETILPGLYPGRTRHIHVHAQAPDRPMLTTQLYFPDEPSNEEDGIFDPALVVEPREADDGQEALFDFVLALD